MVSNRNKKIQDIYESIIIQEAAGVNPDEWLEKLLENKKNPNGKKESEESKEPEELGKPEVEKKEEKLELPGQLREVEYPEQLPLFPGTGKDLPFKKIYAPSFSMFTECPTCKTKVDPVDLPKGSKQYLYRKECPRCKYLYNRMKKMVEERGITPDAAARALSTPKYNQRILKEIWKLEGNTEILDIPIQRNETPSIRQRVEDALRFRLNVQRDKSGDIQYDQQGFPIPLRSPKFMTTYDLARHLRWTPDHLVSFLEDKGFKPIPLGGPGSIDMPDRSPEQKELTGNEQRLRKLELTLKSLENPKLVLIDLQKELEHLQTELKKLQTPGGPDTQGLRPDRPKGRDLPPEVEMERIKELKLKILNVQNLIKKISNVPAKGNEGQISKIKQEINKLKPIIEREEVEGTERFKTSWYNVWNLDTVKEAIKERQEEVEKVIKPAEKAMYFGKRAQYFEQVVKKMQQLQARLQGEKDVLKSNLETMERKAFALLYQWNLADAKGKKKLESKIQETLGYDGRTLETTYGKDLHRYMTLQEMKTQQIADAKKKEKYAQDQAETYSDKFVEFTTGMGYKWTGEDGKELGSKEELLKELSAILEESEIEEDMEESENLEQPAEEQIPLWEEPEKKTETPSGGLQFFQHERKPKEQLPKEEEEEKEPKTTKQKKQKKVKKETPWIFGNIKGTYYYHIVGKTPDNKNVNVKGNLKFVPEKEGEKLESLISSNLKDLAAKHQLNTMEGLRAKMTVRDPKKRTQSFTFHIQNGEPIWHGTRIIKTRLLDSNIKLKTLWSQDIITLDDIIEIDGKLYEKSELGKPQVEKAPHKTQELPPKGKRARIEFRINEIERKLKEEFMAERTRKRLEMELQILKLELIDLELGQKGIPDERRQELETEQTNLKAEIFKLKESEKLVKKDESEIESETPKSPFYTSPKTTEVEPTTDTKPCPYEGCDARIAKDAKVCWKCKSPLDTKNKRHKVVMDLLKITKEVEVIDEVTGEKVPEMKEFFVPRFSLITIDFDNEGKPAAATCQELSSTKRPISTKPVPALTEVWKEAEELAKELLADKNIPEEKKSKIKVDNIYNVLVKRKKENGEIHGKTNAWAKERPAVGIPRKPCEKCPQKVLGPFDAEKLANVCPDISKAIKSLSKTVSNVWDYNQVRLITEREQNKDLEKKKRIDTKPWYMADDKREARFNKIIKLKNS